MKASLLRQSILQAAVQGKLVPQNVHDEPASELLARIRQEKAQLVKEGKIKKEKPLPPIAEDEVPYDLPDGWTWCRLGEIVSKVGSGSTPSGGRNAYPQSGVKFLRSQNVYNHGLVLRGVAFVDDATHERMKNTKVLSRDILLNITGASIGRCCIVPDDFDTANVNQHVSIIRTIDDSIRFYLHILLTSPHLQNHIMDAQVGVSREGLSSEKIKLFLVPLPSLAEQQRIVAKVDELMALCDELEAAEKELDTLEVRFAEYLPKSILQAAVQGKLVPQNVHDEPASELLARIRQEKARLMRGGRIKKEKPLPPIAEDEVPYDLPDGWVWCRLGEVGTFIRGNGIKRSDICSNGVPCIRYGEIYTTYSIYTDKATSFVEESVASKSVSLEYGDVLMTLTGENKEEIGKAVAFLGNEKTVIGGDLATFTNHHQDAMYLSYYLNSPFALLQKAIMGTGNIIVHISCDKLSSILLSLPPLAEQQRIVAKVDELMSLCDELKTARNISIKPLTSNVVQFPQKDFDDEDIGIAARGDGEDLPPEALADIAKLFGEDENA